MTISRRNFIKIGGISTALLTTGSLGAVTNIFGQPGNIYGKSFPPEVYTDALFSYRAETFRKLIGSEFSLFADDFAAAAVLTEVRDSPFTDGKKLRGRTTTVSSEDFTLSFKIPYANAKQAIYTVIHRRLGQFDLLLVPAQNAGGEFLLDAVINRL